MNSDPIELLFEPLKMKNLKLKNRFFMAPIGTTLDMKQWEAMLVSRAKGGVAMITTGEISIHWSGRSGPVRELRLENDKHIQSFLPVIRSVQMAGARLVAQLNHTGRYSFGKLTGYQPVAPSPIASRYTGETPRELTTGEVDELVEAFSEAVLRARKAGFDGVEFLGSSGYLISQFLSPITNKRTDKYGGDRLERANFLLSILRETRNKVGEDFNICVKLDAEDSMPGGKTLDDSVFLAPYLVSAGADRLHIWAGWHEANRPMLPMSVPRGAFSPLASAIKKVVDVPISTVGRINDPNIAAKILKKGDADLIGLGRALLCDPDFVNKTREGRLNEIRRCTACCYCFDELMKSLRGGGDMGLKCSLNPELGREGEGLIRPVKNSKNVVVVGAGPAGLEAARVSAIRGENVTIFEESDRLGGMVNLAVIPPHKNELKNIIDYYSYQMEILPITLRLNESFTDEKIKDVKPDIVILATGAIESLPQLPGIKKSHVMTALDVLKGREIDQRHIVIIGGGLIGVETAELLADQGKIVTIIEMLNKIASNVGPTNRWGLLSRIKKKKINVIKSARVTQIKENSVFIESKEKENFRKEIPAEVVIVATGLESRVELIKILQDRSIEFHIIGSCRSPRLINNAIEEGFDIGCKI